MANENPKKKIAPTATGNAYLEYVPHFTTQPQRAAYTINLGCCGDKSNASLQFSNEKCQTVSSFVEQRVQYTASIQ